MVQVTHVLKNVGENRTGRGWVSVGLNIVGVAIPYWFYSTIYALGPNDGTGDFKFGLWKACGYYMSHQGVDSKCFSIEERQDEFPMPSEFRAVRSLEIIAIIVITASGVLVCLEIFWRKEDKRLLYIAAISAVIAGLFMIIGAIVFVANNKYKKLIEQDLAVNLKPHAGFALCIVSGGLSLAAGGLYVNVARRVPG